MKTVADTLGVSRSNLIERLKGKSKPRGPYNKVGDAELLPAIRRLVDQRPTYGYRRIAATPHAIEHLSDNGSAYTARDTRLFAQALNLTPCFTPVASPQSNGMSGAFVKTLKRDYVRISALPDAETALRLIDGWIEDYNEIHPHSALKMASPRQFIRAKSN